jgi:hypothetical protein
MLAALRGERTEPTHTMLAAFCGQRTESTHSMPSLT